MTKPYKVATDLTESSRINQFQPSESCPLSFERVHYLVAIAFVAVVILVFGLSQWPIDFLNLSSSDDQPEPRIVATVNGTPVFRDDLAEEALAQSLIVDKEFMTLNDKSIRSLLDDMINQILLAEEARSRGIDQREAARRAVNRARDRALSELMLREEVDRTVTEDSLRALFEEQKKLAPSSEEVHARHILVKTTEEADKVAQRLARGEDFVELAKELSIDPGSGPKGGDLGYFTREQMVEVFSSVAFSTPPGEVSPPFESQFGWHVLKVEDKREKEMLAYEDLREQMLRYQTFQVMEDLIKELRAGAQVDYVLPGEPNE